ncbi:unnamed protein product [Lupinus luteus]|uniref:protein-serine/threonine phosphatase n=1 Tax=Lupinus luteus TaxID=3873 RepID=A0AAV1W6N5_LUPLU
MFPTVAVPFTVGNLIQKEITGLELVANTAATLILNPAIEDCHSYSVETEKQHTGIISPQHRNSVYTEVKGNQIVAELVSEMVSPVHKLSTNCSEIDSPIAIKGKPGSNEPHGEIEPDENMASVAKENGSGSDGCDQKPTSELIEKQTCRTSSHNALELSGNSARYGFSSVCGMRQEMEDAIAVKPHLFQVPSQMLMDDDHVNENTKYSSADFFGVYDGHGGCQVANYCQEHLHSVLVKEFEAVEAEKNGNDNWQDHWKKAFFNCFHTVDDDVGRVHASSGSNSEDESESSIELLAETVGSTAVVAVLTQTDIIVANCGDSRAVLYRGKEALPLSSDHKPNRDDEWTRIEAAGGKVIQWNGYRVLGVLAVSRSIGDHYLKPWIIPEPEVTFIHREKNDECLILASDGLWDVITNEEACDIARKRILIWHKKNGNNVSTGQGHGADPAAQYAAEYLSKLALQKGSKDNISIIVIDLKAQRKLKTKT